MTPLEQLGQPYYYRVANAAEAGFAAPENRHGQSVRTWVRSFEGMQKEALVYSAATGKSWRFASDEGTYLYGADIAPNPLSFLSVGMIASYMNEITALADIRNITLHDVHLVLENFYYRSGSFPRGTMVGGVLPPELKVSCQADCDDQTMTQLLFEAISASPLNGLATGALTSLFTFTHNGRVLAPEHLASLEGEPFDDPGDRFPKLVRDDAAGIVQPLIEKLREEADVIEDLKKSTHKSPEIEEGKSLLHLRTTCILDQNGVKKIVKQQFAPTTSNWQFACDEAEGFGGQGRAPDAASYISAGIAFCFMTQLGRYAKMAKLALNDYRVIQDTHFSLGGASGKTGKAGTADAVETHIYMNTDIEDTEAQEILRVAEQTCFLHAFCRTDVKPKVRFDRAPVAVRA